MCITSLRFGDYLQIAMDKKKWLDPHVSTVEEREWGLGGVDFWVWGPQIYSFTFLKQQYEKVPHIGMQAYFNVSHEFIRKNICIPIFIGNFCTFSVTSN